MRDVNDDSKRNLVEVSARIVRELFSSNLHVFFRPSYRYAVHDYM
jgi:hypothetical protein